ncbi:MAG TPA: B12-binding domain-containing protein [Pyrinomonadaceae bacterium]|nr:B12-binding domain-containing protein [Pyrinomonadaceae bacterium]
MELKCLTTKEVARLCRVSDATVKRWEDAGLLRSERTNGGHRRFRAEEVARFQREKGLGLKIYNGDESILRAATRGRVNTDQSDCTLYRSLVAGCEEEAANVLVGAHLRGEDLAEIFDDLVCPAMRRIGELWYKGELSITREHIATRVVCNAVYKLRNVLPVVKMNGALAMCGAVEGDFHELSTHLTQMVLENEGWEVLNFGANTPLYSLAEEIIEHSPEVICISAMVIGDIERLSRDYKTFTEQIGKLKIPIILGGRAFEDEAIRRRFPADLYARSFGEAAAFVRRLTDKI